MLLPKPSIMKVPESTSPIFGGAEGCGYYKGSKSFRCSPYGSSCIDATYSAPKKKEGCSYTLGVGVTGAGATVGVAIGIALAPT